MHTDLVDTGLAQLYKMTDTVDQNDPRAEWLGKTVRYKRGQDWRRLGTLARDEKFIVREVQDNFAGDPVLRIYCLGYNDTFGRVASVENLELV